MTEPTPAQIDAGAKVLRERQMSGKFTRRWDILPLGDKRKWLEHAKAVLDAALAPPF